MLYVVTQGPSDDSMMPTESRVIGINTRTSQVVATIPLPLGITYVSLTADGKRFLIASPADGGASVPPLTVVANWDLAAKK